MVAREFDAIWEQVEAQAVRNVKRKTAADRRARPRTNCARSTRKIAERRVRLGLVLARIGEQNGIMVSPDELQRAIMARARQYQGHERGSIQLLQFEPQAQAEIRAPIFEEKVVDFI